jgi:uncharacterized repeat protein (TIGR01451 family)
MRRRAAATGISLLVLATMLVAAPPAGAVLPITPDDTWGADGRVLAVLRSGGTLYLGGEFTALVPDEGTGVMRNHLGALDAATGQPSAFNPDLNGNVINMTLSPDGNVLYVVGGFTKVGTVTRKRIAAFNVDTGALLPWNPTSAPNNTVQSAVIQGNTIYVGGSFTKAGTIVRTRLAAYDATTGALLPWAPTANKSVRDLVAVPGRIYVGGYFTTIGSVTGRSIAALNPTTGAVFSGVYHPGYPVLDMEVSGTRIFAAGAGAGGRALAISVSAGAKLWERKSDGNIQGVGVQGSFAYFGGHFFKYDNKSVSQLVRVDPTTGVLDQSWLPTSNGFLGVFAVEGFGSRLYAGGDFDHVSGQKQLHFAQFTDSAVTNDADVAVSLTDAPDPVDVGTDLTYTARVSNDGPDPATSTILTDVLPAGVTFVNASTGCTYAPGPRTVTCALGTLGVGVEVNPTITVAPGSSGTLQNTASVDANENDPSPSNNSSIASTTVQSVPGVDLNLAVAAPTQVQVGTQYAYVLTVTNQGSDPATALTVNDLVPANTSPVSVVPSQGSCSGQSSISCGLGGLAVGAQATVTITVVAPSSPMTLINTANASDPAFDPDDTDNQVTSYTTVRIASSDTTPPAVTTSRMFDDDHDGKADRATVTFDEALAVCPAPCTFGWTLTDVPSDGHLLGVDTSGSTATLTLGEGMDDPDTAVGLFRIALSGPNGIQDAAGNHAAFAARAPTDGAAPIPIAFRQGHPSTSECTGLPSTPGVAEVCDTLTSEWSEALLPASIPSTTPISLTDPAGAGNDLLTIPGFFASPFDGGGDGYVTTDDSSAVWTSSQLRLAGPTGSDYLTAKIFGSCTGAGCTALGAGPKITVTYVPSTSIQDLAGNAAAGQYVKPQKITLF